MDKMIRPPEQNPMDTYGKGPWFDRERRLEQLDEQVRQKGWTRFGFEKLRENEKRDRVCKHFDAVADKYDITNTLLSFGLHYLWKRRAINMAGLRPEDRVLDVCGGTGDLSILADRAVGQAGRVVLYDINRKMIAAGRNKATNTAARRRIQYVQGDAEQIAFPDDAFDTVMVGFAMRNITHPKKAFHEMIRVLKPGGTFLCLEFSRPVWVLFRQLYDHYSFRVMPILGGFITGSRRAYACLPETIRAVLMPAEFSEIFREEGLTRIRYRSFSNGIAVALLGSKGEASLSRRIHFPAGSFPVPTGEQSQAGTRNVDQSEIAKFDRIASRWWDRYGERKSLHDINPLRVGYISARAPLEGARVLDVGCGGGILSEAMARAGALVTGIDLGARTLEAARRHAEKSGLAIHYRQTTVEAIAASRGQQFDLITCMELLEHVPDPRSIIRACAELLAPGGSLICATVSRSVKSFFYAIIGAEYILHLLPVGSHTYARFIKPEELSGWGKPFGLQVEDATGLGYNPFTRRYFLTHDVSVNYLMHLKRRGPHFKKNE